MNGFSYHLRVCRTFQCIWVCAGCLWLLPFSYQPAEASTEAMVQRLEKLAKRSNPVRNIFLSSLRARMFAEQAAQATTQDKRMDLMLQEAVEWLQAGASEKAMEGFNAWEAMARQVAPDLYEKNHYLLKFYQSLCWIRVGEQENCLANHTTASCLMPIQAAGVHRLRRGSEGALSILKPALERYPEDLSLKWLFNIASMTLGHDPETVSNPWWIPASTWSSDADIGVFPDIAGSVGADVNALSGGTVLDDFNGDGLIDILVTAWGFHDSPTYLQNDGEGRFTDRTRESGLLELTGGLNMVSADYDNDGDIDVFVLRGAWLGSEGRIPNSLWQNDGKGHFEDVTDEAGVLSSYPTQTAVWWDMNNDGWLDLFVGNESTPRNRHRSELYVNNQDGTFTEQARACGLSLTSYIKATAVADIDHDGWLDLYISNYDAPNQLFRNIGPVSGKSQLRRFVDVARQAGVSEPVHSFPCWFFDADQDGWQDLFVAGYKIKDVGEVAADVLGQPHQASKARLYRNRGDGTFEDQTQSLGLDQVLHTMGSNYGDVNNDGYPDFYLGTGDPDLATLIPNRLFLNQGGRRFADITTSAGMGHLQKGHGIGFADLDNDGDQDVYANMGGAYEGDLYRNALFLNPGHEHHWLKLRLHGVHSNRMGVGSRVSVRVKEADGSLHTFHRVVRTGGSFGASPLRIEMGLGKATALEALTIHWHGSGTQQTWKQVPMDACIDVVEGKPGWSVLPHEPIPFSKDHSAHGHP